MEFVPGSVSLFTLSSVRTAIRFHSSQRLTYLLAISVLLLWPQLWTPWIGSGVGPNSSWANESIWRFGSRFKGFPVDSNGKESACNVGYPGSIPGSGRSPGEGNGNPFQYSYLENPMDRGVWRATWGDKELERIGWLTLSVFKGRGPLVQRGYSGECWLPWSVLWTGK